MVVVRARDQRVRPRLAGLREVRGHEQGHVAGQAAQQVAGMLGERDCGTFPLLGRALAAGGADA